MKVKHHIIFTLSPGFILVLLVFFSLRRELTHCGELCIDCFYHLAMALQGPSVFMGREFPTLTMSVWSDRFADKELLYHLLLYPMVGVQRWLAGAITPPFNLTATMVFAVLSAAFFLVAHQLRLRPIWLWALIMLFCSFEFMQRIMMLRPHVLGSAMFLFTIAALLITHRRYRNWTIFGVGFLYAWAYSNPHFMLLPLAGFAVCRWRRERWRAVITAVIGVGGLFAGLIIHPQFPHNLLIWKIQAIDVIVATFDPELKNWLGMELNHGGWRNAIASYLLYFMAVLDFFYLLILLVYREKRIWAPSFQAIGLISFIGLVGVFVNTRALEYAVPCTVLFTGMMFHLLGHRLCASGHRRLVRIISPGVPLMVALGMGLWTLLGTVLWNLSVITPSPQLISHPSSEFAAAARKAGLPPGTIIGNLFWADFPALFFSCPQYRYLGGLDPMFSYAADPVRTTRLMRFNYRKLKLTPPELRQLIGTRYAFVSNDYRKLAVAMFEQDYGIVYQGRDGWLFDLDIPVEQVRSFKRIYRQHKNISEPDDHTALPVKKEISE